MAARCGRSLRREVCNGPGRQWVRRETGRSRTGFEAHSASGTSASLAADAREKQPRGATFPYGTRFRVSGAN